MSKFKCTICGDIYDEEKEGVKFSDLPESWVCPICGVPKSLFEEVNEEIVETKDETPSNAIKISSDNTSIERDISKCINCGICKQTCSIREGFTFDKNSELCVNCGQCIQTCPVGSLMPKNEYQKFLDAKSSGKICIAYTSPSVRVSFAESFGLEPGSISTNKLVGFLRSLGFDYVFDTTFAADLTIMEEANELVNRINNNGVLPMFTSCCPAWVKYAEQFYPDVLPNISTCKSPIGMMGPVVKKYFAESNNIDSSNIYTVAITPCTAKKFEISREEIDGTDLVLTVLELIGVIKKNNISYDSIEESEFDSYFPEGTGSGIIFGNTGGVMEAALREAYYILTNEILPREKIVFNEVRGMNNVKESTITINDLILNIAVVHQMSSLKPILESIKNGTCKYHYIEVMNCLGGCIGGGGQPIHMMNEEITVKEKRISSLYKKDEESQFRLSHENLAITKLYKEYLGKPNSELSEDLLHTTYINRENAQK